MAGAKIGFGGGEERDVHWLPCRIAHTGPASVDRRFDVQLTDGASDGGHLRSTFRGRQLSGRKVDLPEGFSCHVLRARPDRGRGSGWESAGRASSVTCWNHDAPPGPCDPPVRCLEWLGVANALALPVDESDVRREADGSAH